MTSFKQLLDKNNGNVRKAWKDARKLIGKKDSNNLKNAVIKRLQLSLQGCGQIDWIEAAYDNEASYLVNNSRSKFYIYG